MNDVYDYYITPEEYSIAESNSIAKATLEKRVRDLGWGKQRAITQAPVRHKSYGGWRVVAERNGISIRTFRKRVYRGWSFKDAAIIPLSPSRGKARRFSEADIAEAQANGICYETFRFRMTRARRKWTLEEAKTRPVMTQSEIGQVVKSVLEKRYGNINGPIFQKKRGNGHE